MRKCSIRAKIIGAGVAAVFVTVLAIALMTSHNQRRNLLDQSGKTLKASASMLNLTVRNLMLAGEAQSTVGILSDLKKVRTLEEVEIYRTDGSRASHDYATLETVNDRLEKGKVPGLGRAGARRRGGKLRGTKVPGAELPEQKPPAATFPVQPTGPR